MSGIENDTMTTNAMQIIMLAGDARSSCTEALKQIAEMNMGKAAEFIKEADQQIAQAHHIQTDAIQSTIGGDSQEYSLLFSHAQDTLMTIYSEIHMTKRLMSVFEGLDSRLKILENK